MIFSIDETLKLVMRQNNVRKVGTSRNVVPRRQKLRRRSPVPSISYNEADDDDDYDVASSKVSFLSLDDSIDTALESFWESSRRSASPKVSPRALGAEKSDLGNFLKTFDNIKVQAGALMKNGVCGLCMIQSYM